MRRWRLGQTLSLLAVAACMPALAGESLPPEVEQVKPSVVAVVTYNRSGKSSARGSGFLTGECYVISVRHIVDGAHRAEIRTNTGESYPAAVHGQG
jgi:S1-C subfamily serine protease